MVEQTQTSIREMASRDAVALMDCEAIASMIDSAKLEYGLDYEMSFVISAAYLDGLLLADHFYSDELLEILQSPEDDVGATLRMLELKHSVGEIRFLHIASQYGIDAQKFARAEEMANILSRLHERFARGIRPYTMSTKIEAISNLFARYFITNPCIYVETNDDLPFFDYEKNFYFDISSQSRLHVSPGFYHERPAVYFRLLPSKCCTSYAAHFLCFVPMRMVIKMKYSKIYHKLWPIGYTVGRRILQNIDVYNRACDDPKYIALRNYDEPKGVLDVLCTNNSRAFLKNLIDAKIIEIAEELANLQHRHFPIKRHNLIAIIGPGLQVIDVILDETTSDSIFFQSKTSPKICEAEEKHLCQMIKQFSDLFAAVLVYNKTSLHEKLVVTFPSTHQAEKAIEYFRVRQSNAYTIELFHWDSSDFFLQKAVDIPDPKRFVRAACLICFIVPDHKIGFIRTELCGHTYCTNCFLKTVQHADKFPIACVSVHCCGTFTFNDFQVAFENHGLDDTEKLTQFLKPIIDKSFKYFMRFSHSGYKRCMRLNCKAILNVPRVLHEYGTRIDPALGTFNNEQRRILNGRAVLCKSCGHSRCGICGYDFHAGIDCQEFYANNFVYNDAELAVWKNDDPETRRFCPNSECHILMEKSEGCNHMQCTACGIHFCWLCKDFQTPDSKSIYAHMTIAHGGNGLEMADLLPLP